MGEKYILVIFNLVALYVLHNVGKNVGPVSKFSTFCKGFQSLKSFGIRIHLARQGELFQNRFGIRLILHK